MPGLPVNFNLAFVRAVQAVQLADEGAFSGAIFTQQGMDFTGVDVKIDVIIGQDARESFDNTGQAGGVDTGAARGEEFSHKWMIPDNILPLPG